jgi:signal transduction histidine kinase/ActR/RegA family two-component response regulator
MAERDERGSDDQDPAINVGLQAEIKRLGDELAEAREQLAATSKVLAAIGRSTSDLEAVLETVVESARTLCDAEAGLVFRVDGSVCRFAHGSGMKAKYREFITDNPPILDRRSLAGRVVLDRRATQITDVLADHDYGRTEAQSAAGYRTIMGVPMLIDDEAVGVLELWRDEVAQFSDREVEVLTNFAAQAAIAVRTVDLVRALARKVNQLETLGALGQGVSSTKNLIEELTTIIMQAVNMSGTDGGSIYEFDEDGMEFRIRSSCGTSPEVLDALGRIRIGLDDTFLGRVATRGHPMGIPEIRDEPADPHLSVLAKGGWRSLVAFPMVREGRIVGALVVRRHTPGHLPDEISDLLESFASRSELALSNAQLFRRLERQSAEFELASRNKSKFLAWVCHDQRNLLTPIVGFSERLLGHRYGERNERQDEYVRDILSAGNELLELVNDILDLSKIEAGQMDLNRSGVLVREELEYCISQVREQAHKQGIQLSLEAGPEVGVLDADAKRFRQVVRNLLTNAVKFTPGGGAVDVRASIHGQDLIVTVADTGVGVADEDRQRIFDSYEQGTRRSGQAEGTGLGLTLSKRFIELHGGRIWLESEVGKGSTFGFALPGGSDEPELLSVPLATTNAGLATEPTRMTHAVLVVEDNERNLKLLRHVLEDAGYDVRTARTAEEGISMAISELPNLILMDLQLPGIDGVEALRRLRECPPTADIPVVAVTAQAMKQDRERALEAGFDGYIEKPIKVLEFPDQVRKFLSDHEVRTR